MIFKKCVKCDQDLTPGNCDVKINALGMWLNHPECKGTSMLTRQTVQRRSSGAPTGDAVRELEKEYYHERLKEIDASSDRSSKL